jgi:hypothetical protein
MSSFSFSGGAVTANFIQVASGRDGSADIAVKNCLLDLESRGENIFVIQINPPVFDPVGGEFYCTAIFVDLVNAIPGTFTVSAYGETVTLKNNS